MRLPGRFVLLPICALLTLSPACIPAFPAAEGKFERMLSVTGPVDLEVSTGSGRIDIRSGGAATVQIIGIVRAGDDWKSNAQEKVRYITSNPPIEQTGNVIRLGRISNEAYKNNVSISYDITVPADTQVRSKTGSGGQQIEGVRRSVDASTGSGSITMRDIGGEVTAQTGSGGIELDRVSGRVDAHTGSGSIRAERILGSIQAETGSGRITLEQTSAERGGIRDVQASTGSGGIDIAGANGSVRAQTGSGGISVEGNPAGDWEIHSSSGGITLRLPANAAFDLYARSSSGNITVDHPVTISGTVTKKELQGKVRGGGRLIDVRTGSGSIKVR